MDPSAENAQKSNLVEIDGELYIQESDGLADKPHQEPKRRYAEKTIRGIVIGRGENREIIDIDQVRKLAALNCSYLDMAKFFGVKETTFKDNFRREVERARETTKHRLMEAMIENAITRMNPTVQIWLSKNLLGFTDQPQNTTESVPLPWSDED